MGNCFRHPAQRSGQLLPIRAGGPQSQGRFFQVAERKNTGAIRDQDRLGLAVPLQPDTQQAGPEAWNWA